MHILMGPWHFSSRCYRVRTKLDLCPLWPVSRLLSTDSVHPRGSHLRSISRCQVPNKLRSHSRLLFFYSMTLSRARCCKGDRAYTPTTRDFYKMWTRPES